MNKPSLCQDDDPDCPYCYGKCSQPAKVHLARSDYADKPDFYFCEECAKDALLSDVFFILEENTDG